MCGISGFVAFPGARTDYQHHDLVHRGPDGRGAARLRLTWGVAHFSMTRLAIMDQRKLQVPFKFTCAPEVLLAYNGELYNYQTLRHELADGVPWETDCDAEIIVRAWKRWGVHMLDHFNGMFALALADGSASATHTILLARDRAGEKPLYYAELPGNDGLAFASEIKALPVELIEVLCEEMETLEFDCSATTPFKDVYALEPGTYLLLTAPAIQRPETWWRLPMTTVDESMTQSYAVDTTHELLIDAIKIRQPRDTTTVPWTVLVSGGLDSAIIQAVVQAPRVYCATFPEIDNLALARLAAPEAEIVPVTFDLQQARDALPQIAYHLDTPATWSSIALWFLARAMRKNGNKVVLSGEGADELFGGYTRYRVLWWLDQCRTDPLLANYKPVLDVVLGGSDITTVCSRLLDRSHNHTWLPFARMLVDQYLAPRAGYADTMARTEFYTTMQVLLRMADRMIASVGMENRAPFLDYRLMELAARIPTKHKITERWSKAILRVVAKRLGVHEAIVNETTKRGLVIPWNVWCRQLPGQAPRGAWDRQAFKSTMLTAWRDAFKLV